MRLASEFVLLIFLLPISVTLALNLRADEKELPKFVVVAPKIDVSEEFGASLYRVLIGRDQRAKFERVETIEEAVASSAEVIVLAMPSSNVPVVEKAILESLKNRKIVGIGYGAATLFGQLGLEINDEQCAHGTASPPRLTIVHSELLGEPNSDEPVSVLIEPADATPKINDGEAQIRDLFAIFLPPSESRNSGIDVIASWSSEPNYAPIVRQGNCVLIGIASPVRKWTKSYAELVGRTCMALHQRKLEKFSTIRREVTKSGKYAFQLAPRNSTDKPFVKNLYFQFSKPTKLRAELEHSDSAAVMLSFYGQGLDGTHSERQDALKGETLTVTKEITAEDIIELDGHYWVLDVTNFDPKAEANCKLTITIEEL